MTVGRGFVSGAGRGFTRGAALSSAFDIETSGQTPANGGFKDLPFPSGNEVDSDGWKQVGDILFTVPPGRAGDYSISAGLRTTSVVSDFKLGIKIVVNGTAVASAMDDRVTPAGGDRNVNASTIQRLVAGDEIKIQSDTFTDNLLNKGRQTIARQHLEIHQID